MPQRERPSVRWTPHARVWLQGGPSSESEALLHTPQKPRQENIERGLDLPLALPIWSFYFSSFQNSWISKCECIILNDDLGLNICLKFFTFFSTEISERFFTDANPYFSISFSIYFEEWNEWEYGNWKGFNLQNFTETKSCSPPLHIFSCSEALSSRARRLYWVVLESLSADMLLILS